MPSATTARSENTSESGPETCHQRNTRQRSCVLHVNSLLLFFQLCQREDCEIGVAGTGETEHGHLAAVPSIGHRHHFLGASMMMVRVVHFCRLWFSVVFWGRKLEDGLGYGAVNYSS